MKRITPELQAAVNRLRRDGYSSEIALLANEPTGNVIVPGGVWDDVTDLADAYLAEHPADDGEGYTPDGYCLSCGTPAALGPQAHASDCDVRRKSIDQGSK